MGTAWRRHRTHARGSERLRVHAAIRLTTVDGHPLAPLARCIEIGLGGVRVQAAEAIAPGTRVRLHIRLPSGTRVEVDGCVAWSRQTIHLSLFGAPRGNDNDAEFGIAFEASSDEQLLPIARLLAARDRQKLRARRIRRLHGLPIHA